MRHRRKMFKTPHRGVDLKGRRILSYVFIVVSAALMFGTQNPVTSDYYLEGNPLAKLIRMVLIGLLIGYVVFRVINEVNLRKIARKKD